MGGSLLGVRRDGRRKLDRSGPLIYCTWGRAAKAIGIGAGDPVEAERLAPLTLPPLLLQLGRMFGVLAPPRRACA